MTERLYYTSDATEGREHILRCEPDAEGRYAVELDRTLFHPLSQPLLPGEVSIEVDAAALTLPACQRSVKW